MTSPRSKTLLTSHCSDEGQPIIPPDLSRQAAPSWLIQTLDIFHLLRGTCDGHFFFSPAACNDLAVLLVLPNCFSSSAGVLGGLEVSTWVFSSWCYGRHVPFAISTIREQIRSHSLWSYCAASHRWLLHRHLCGRQRTRSSRVRVGPQDHSRLNGAASQRNSGALRARLLFEGERRFHLASTHEPVPTFSFQGTAGKLRLPIPSALRAPAPPELALGLFQIPK